MMVTKAEFLFMIHLVHIPSHLVHTAANLQCTSNAHTLQQTLHLQCTLQQIFSAPPVHTHCSSHYIFSAHYSKSSVHLQCTHTAAVITFSVHLQCTHTAAVITSSVHTAANLQCTFEPPQGKPIPLLAYLQNSQQTLMVEYSSPYDEENWLSVAVH